MARSVWKLGKFDKGINSHTDPKDINSDEWVELDDVNVSKVGIAKVLGRPKSDTSIHQPEIGTLIGGKGLYRFTSDNSYMPNIAASSAHILENTIDGGGGVKSHALFGIKSLVWLFSTAKPPSDATTTVSFQLKIGGTAIMDAMVCLSGNMAQNTGDTTSTTTNVFDDVVEDSSGDLFTSTTAKYTNIPHNLCVYPENSNTGINNVNGWNDVMSNGHYIYTSNLFWDGDFLGGDHHDENNNLNQNGIPFSATYDSDGYPTGTLDFHTHYMLGFYYWEGYNEDVLADGETSEQSEWGLGDFQPANWADSGFIVPRNIDDSNSYDNYKKARLSFMGNLIKAINSYSGSGSNDYQAEFNENGGTVHLTDNADDMIVLVCSNDGVMTGDGLITAEITCSAAGGTSSFVTSGINLLTDSDRYGQGYGISDWQAPDDSILSDIEVIDSSAGAMVLQGEGGVTSGSTGVTETWRLTIRGDSNSEDIIEITIQGTGDSVANESVRIVAKYATNQLFVAAIKSEIDALSDYAAATGAEASGYNDSNTPYYTDITSDTVGTAGQFNITIRWITDNSLNISSIGVEDEQLCLISKTSTLLSQNIFKGYLTDFLIWSGYATTWVDRYSNKLLNSINENDSSNYLNWYHTALNDNDPVFYDEGSTLRISESNFSLLQELDEMIKSANITDGVNNNPAGYMWANPVQWIGYKDISNHFINSDGDISFSYGVSDVKGFFIGKQAKIWSFTESGNIGLSQTNNQGAAGLDDADDIIAGENAKMIISTYKHDSGGGVDWVGTIKIYAVACYDDESETLPGHKFTTNLTFGDTDGVEDGDTFRMQILFRPATITGLKCFNDVRVNGIRLYYTHSEENHSTFWNLGKFDFNRGFIKAATVNTVDDTLGNEATYKWENANIAAINTQTGSEDNITVTNKLLGTYPDSPNAADTIIEYLEMPKTESYEDINGHSVNNDTLHVEYKAVCIAGRRIFVGNIRVWNGSFYEYYNDRMVVSPVNSLDTFPYPDNILDLEISDGDKIIALASFGDKVIQFKQYMLYVMNISTGIASEFFIEERHKWKGILNKNHFCYTDEGVFWVNERGAWIYDGDELKDLFILDSEDESQQKIDSVEWLDFISDETLVGYNALSREIIIVKKHTHATDLDADCFVYSLIVNSWTKGKKRFFSNTNKSMTNFQTTGSLGKLSYFIEETPNSAQDDAEIR
mgnify:CR=1 FL=1